MTTKPKAKKFRVRRGQEADAPVEGDATPVNTTNLFDNEAEDGFPDMKFATAAKDEAAAQEAKAAIRNGEASTLSVADEIDAIKAEGLTGRQLRMARRVAQKNGLTPESDFDAVRQLRAKGIDPFERANMLELVVADQQNSNPGQLPQTVPAAQPPATAPGPQELPPVTEAERAAEIQKIQRDIARRRKKSISLLFTRLAFFILLPTLIAGYYYYMIATPLYATKTEFVIQTADSGGGGGQGMGGGLGSMLSGTGLATSQDSITVQAYLLSREAMLRLDEEYGFKSHFQQDNIDPLTRLDEDATNESAYKLYKKQVIIGYDPTEGLMRMEVIAADPETSVQYSQALLSYAEEQVDNLTQRLREDQMAGSFESRDSAEAKMLMAQQRVIQLQEAQGVLSAEAIESNVMSQISTFQVELQNERLRLEEMLSNRRPNQSRVEVAERNIANLENLIADLRAEISLGSDSTASLARISAELMVAQADLMSRQEMLQAAIQQQELARIEANRQTRYISMGVRPIAPDEATYPRRFENTVLALLIFSGIYLMCSLTASILREQVSS